MPGVTNRSNVPILYKYNYVLVLHIYMCACVRACVCVCAHLPETTLLLYAAYLMTKHVPLSSITVTVVFFFAFSFLLFTARGLVVIVAVGLV